MGKIQYFKDISGQWRFRIIANNHKIVAVSESYKKLCNAKKGAAAVERVFTEDYLSDIEEIVKE